MNIPLLLSISPDSSEVMDLEVRVCWTRAGWLHVTAVIPSPRHEVWPSSLSVSLWRTHWSVACRADGSGSAVHFLIILHVGLLPWACDHRAFCSTSLLCSALFCLSRRFGHSPSSLARSLCMLRKSAKWHPGGNQKHALASLSLLLEIIWDYVRFLALRWLQANTQACTNARRGIKAWVLCCGKVLITEAQKVGTGLLTQSTQS